MISLIVGTIVSKGKNTAVILTQSGVGYEVSLQVSKLSSLHVNDEITLHTYMKVSENSMELFGFEAEDEKGFFEILLSVKGVGPRGALSILGLGSIEEIKSAISRSDVSYLTQVSGMGKRTAERLCVELKNKITSIEKKDENGEKVGDKLGEVVDGLVGMGYSKEQARDIVKGLDESKPVEELLRDALKGIQ
ncbi:Holliday junction branch migration protein RuvA [Candidatus Parcubacteria bacterium]|nr:MAG: Holliday junction branch migration protein RuvA [Candidatus Parcubacteria bacterium]